MPNSAKTDFLEDIDRARAILAHSNSLPDGLLKDDLRRSAWMFSVGALDAYFCDAFADIIARVLNCKREEPAINIPDNLENLKVPVVAVISSATDDGWRWRLVARDLIEDENVLSFKKIKELFNRFFPENRKVLCNDHLADWILHRESQRRLFGISRNEFKKLLDKPRSNALDKSKKQLSERFEFIFQRRHDCIHNCDRPKVAIQRAGIDTAKKVGKVIDDISFFVNRMDETIIKEFKAYLKGLGFSARLRNKWTNNL
jgi:hypothetical protein